MDSSNSHPQHDTEVPLIDLVPCEKVDPQLFIGRLIERFHYNPSKKSRSKRDFSTKPLVSYSHGSGWRNRLILGESLSIMNSFLHQKSLKAKIQMIYFDPPYGIGFNTNIQLNSPPHEGNSSNHYSKILDLDSEESEIGENESDFQEQVQVYRDTWKFGINSYLNYLQKRLLLAKDLLAESGSIFVQINDKNLQNVMQLLEEIFGKENFISIIPFKKTGSTSSYSLANVCDFIIWYAKLKPKMKYHQLYIKRAINRETFKTYTKIELSDGTRRNLTSNEKETGLLPTGSKLFTTISLSSQHYSPERSKPFQYHGRNFIPPPNRQWSVSMEGLQTLVEKNRIFETKNTIRFIYYLDDFPISPLGNMWDDTMGSAFSQYAVQTNAKVIQRCMLMTTDPGDIIFDPTCGSGTSSIVAEQWGRRWITCDTSRIAVNIARQRLMTTFFPYYILQEPSKSFTHWSFIFQSYPHITVSSVAYNEPLKSETLYDNPGIDFSKIRVSGSFDVEIPVDHYEISEEKSTQRQQYVQKVLYYLKRDGISLPKSRRMKFQSISQISLDHIHGKGILEENLDCIIAISIGPEHGIVNLTQVESGVMNAIKNGFHKIIFLGLNFDDVVQSKFHSIIPLFNSKSSAHPSFTQLPVEMAFINPDIEIDDLDQDPAGIQMFTMCIHPHVSLQFINEWYSIELNVDENSDSLSNIFDSLAIDPTVSVWFLDDEYDGQIFIVRQAFSLLNSKIEKSYLKDINGIIDQKNIRILKGKCSIPFLLPSTRRIALKIYDLHGNSAFFSYQFA